MTEGQHASIAKLSAAELWGNLTQIEGNRKAGTISAGLERALLAAGEARYDELLVHRAYVRHGPQVAFIANFAKRQREADEEADCVVEHQGLGRGATLRYTVARKCVEEAVRAA